MSRRFSIVALLAASLVVLCLMAGCWPFSPKSDSGDKPPTQELLARTSPENVLFNLRVIYGDKDNIVNTVEDAHTWAESYRGLFGPDTFTFYFDPLDQIPNFPQGWWGLNDEAASFESILTKKAEGVVDDITLSWNVGAAEPDMRFDPDTQQLVHPTWKHIYVSGILLDVVAGTDIWRVPGGTADYYFAPDPANSSLWVITEWRDHQPPPAAPPNPGTGGTVTPTTSSHDFSSWGEVKSILR